MIKHGNCKILIKELPDNSIDCCVTDPPYGLEFMGKEWDKLWDKRNKDNQTNEGVKTFLRAGKNLSQYKAGYESYLFHLEWAKEVYRVLKPGAYLLAFGGTRTYHRLACAIEDAGFEIRDCINYIYGQGFPKSLNIEKFLEKKYGRKEISKHNLRPLQETDISQTINTENKQGKVLQSGLQEQGISPEGKQLQAKIRQGQSSMEGRDNAEKTEGELQECPLCKMPEGISKNGTERRVCNGTQVSNGTTSEQNTNKDRGSSSHRPQSSEQSYFELDALCEQHRTQAIRAWKGWGSALKPAVEMVCVARKPLDGTIAENCMKWGVGAMNIDGGRIGTETRITKGMSKNKPQGAGTFRDDNWQPKDIETISQGRYPANLTISCFCDEYRLKPNIPDEKKKQLMEWLYENA